MDGKQLSISHAEHAAAAYDINAVDYLLKPVRFERLEKAVGKLREALAARGAASAPLRTEEPVEPTGQLTVTVAGKSRVLAPEEIIRISFENGFCYLYVGSERLMSDKYLAHYEERLKGRRFFRASRTDLVNLDCLSAIHRELPGMYVLEMKNGMKVELSRRQARALRALVDF
jgi:DNA-binding LytR/AlgR family response regulator